MGNWLLRGDFGTAPDDLGGMVLGLMLAFLCGHVVAWTYMACHSGLSYSRSFVNSLIVLSIIVSVVMMVMANNLLVAFGLMAEEFTGQGHARLIPEKRLSVPFLPL